VIQKQIGSVSLYVLRDRTWQLYKRFQIEVRKNHGFVVEDLIPLDARGSRPLCDLLISMFVKSEKPMTLQEKIASGASKLKVELEIDGRPVPSNITPKNLQNILLGVYRSFNETGVTES
jgi:hypothetical protein